MENPPYTLDGFLVSHLKNIVFEKELSKHLIEDRLNLIEELLNSSKPVTKDHITSDHLPVVITVKTSPEPSPSKEGPSMKEAATQQ